MKILKVENLVKTYGSGENIVRAVDDVSFEVERGEFVAIVGASGSGKSTLMHIIGGVDIPTSGHIFIDDKEITGMKSDTIHKLTLRSLLMNKSRTAMTIVAIMLSCALITVVAGIGTSAWYSYIYATMNFSGDYDVRFEGSFDDECIEGISRNRDVSGVYYLRNIGLAELPENKSKFKPYMLIKGLNKGALKNCFCAKLSEGRLPENDSEIVLPPSFVSYSKRQYSVGDKLTLSIGDRVLDIGDGNTRSLRYESELFEDGERIDAAFEKEYTVVGILSSVSREISAEGSYPFVSVFTLCDSIDKTVTSPGFSEKPNVLFVNYTASGEKNYINSTAQLVGISEDAAKRHFEGSYEYPVFDTDEYGQPVIPKDFKTERELALEGIAKSNSFGITDFYLNNNLLIAKGVKEGDRKTIYFPFVAGAIIFFIMFVSVFIIRNSIAISVTEKKRLFGMLCSVGATPKQIRGCVFFEALLLVAVGVPLGIAVGCGGTFLLLGVSGTLLVTVLNGNELIFSVPVWALAGAAVLGALTVFMSSFFVSLEVSKVSPIEGVRLTGEIKPIDNRNAKRLRTPKLIKKLFGEGGSIAWKNMKRSKRQYRTTVISLVLSTAVFLTAASIVEGIINYTKQSIPDYPCNMVIKSSGNASWKSKKDNKEQENKTEKYRRFFDEIATNDKVGSYNYDFSCTCYSFEIPVSSIYKSDRGGVPDHALAVDEKDQTDQKMSVVCLDEESYRRILAQIGKTPEELKGKAVLLNRNFHSLQHNNGDAVECFFEPFLIDPVGMMLKGKLGGYLFYGDDEEIEKYDGDRREISIEIGAEIPYDMSFNDLFPDNFNSNATFELFSLFNRSGCLIMQIDDYIDTIENYYTAGTIRINSTDPAELEADISSMGFGEYIYVHNIDSEVKAYNAIMIVMRLFVYGFIAILTLIGVTNIFNTVTTNMKLRQKEFAMLRSVGMTDREFDGMIMLESLFCSFKALLFGIPAGLLTGWGICSLIDLMINAKAAGMSCYNFPVIPVIISVIAVTVIVGSIMLYSVSSIKKQNIIETIRNENI